MMYSFCVTDQLVVFLQSFAFGMLLGTVNNIISLIMGIFILKKNVRTAVSDIVFSIFLAVSAFCFVLSYNLGSFRFYILLGVIFGIFIYVIAFGETAQYICEKVIRLFRKAVGIFFISPVKAFLKIFKKSQKMCKKSLKHIAKKKENVV